MARHTPEELMYKTGERTWTRSVYATERYTGINSGIPYFIRRFGQAEAAKVSSDLYPLFQDRETGEVVMFEIEHHVNPHTLIIGRTRNSGKTTLADIAVRNEIVYKGAFAIFFDPKGEYPTLPYEEIGLKIKRVALQGQDNPVLLKPSKLDKKDWTMLVETYAIGKGEKLIKQGVLKAVRELSRQDVTLSLENILAFLRGGGVKKISPDSMDFFNIETFMDDIQETGMFDEEKGLDLLEIMREYDALVVDTKSPEMDDHIALVAQHLIHQLGRLKVDADPRRGRFKEELADIWPRRVVVLIDEAGDATNGLINTAKELKCKGAVEQIFTKFAYANIVGVIVTQHIQHISTPVVNACSNLWIGRLGEKNTIQRVADMSGLATSTLRMLLTEQGVGEFIWVKGGDYQQVRVILPQDFKRITT